MEDFDVREAFKQIDRGIVIHVPRITQEEIDAFSRPRKRQAKKKYHILSFDSSDEEDEPSPVCYALLKKPKRSLKWNAAANCNSSVSPFNENASNKRKSSRDTPTPTAQSTSTIESPPLKRKSSKEIKRKNSIDTTRTEPSVSRPETGLNSRLLKPVITTEVKLLKQPKDEPFFYCDPTKVSQSDQRESKIPVVAKPEPAAPAPPANSKIGKIRIKTAAELGSKIIFIDDDPPILPFIAKTVNPRTSSSKNTSPKNASRPSVSKNEQAKNPTIDVPLIGDLYAKLFTTTNQTKIQTVAEILQSIAENIKNNNERVQEITNNKFLTDSEKLRRRSLSFQDLKRKQEENEKKLKETFESLMAIFDNKDFELLFQLFFLGILKILIISVSYIYKKGTIFKKLITILLQSLTNAKFKDDRVFTILKSKDFRDKCIFLVKSIEKHCGTFSMLFPTESDKNPDRNAIKGKTSSSSSAHQPSTSTVERTAASHNPSLKSETSTVPESFLLQMLKTSKPTSNDTTPLPPVNHQQQASFKTYAPAQKRNVNVAVSSTNMAPRPIVNSNGLVNSSLPTTNPAPPANTSGSNGLVNNFIFVDGQVKPNPNDVISRPTRPILPNDANHFLHRTPAPPAYPAVNQKVYQVNGNLNGNHFLSTSNGNIENIQPGMPGSYPNKKLAKDNSSSWNGVNGVNGVNGAVNNNGLRSLLANEPTSDPRFNHTNRYLDYAGNFNSSTSFSTPRNGHNAWLG